MNIAIIGGIDRAESGLVLAAKQAGHQLECHTGKTTGRGAEGLRAVVERSELVVIVVQLTSHGAMHLAKQVARQFGRNTLVVGKCGRSSFQNILNALPTYCSTARASR